MLTEQGLPLLAQHGFTEVAEAGRPTVVDVCSILFAIDQVSEFNDRREAFRSDDGWRELLQDWGGRFDRAGFDGMMEYRVELYSAPAGPGKAQPTRKSATGAPTTPPTAWAAGSCGTSCRTATATSGVPATEAA